MEVALKTDEMTRTIQQSSPRVRRLPGPLTIWHVGDTVVVTRFDLQHKTVDLMPTPNNKLRCRDKKKKQLEARAPAVQRRVDESTVACTFLVGNQLPCGKNPKTHPPQDPTLSVVVSRSVFHPNLKSNAQCPTGEGKPRVNGPMDTRHDPTRLRLHQANAFSGYSG